jgi:uncharacterized protein (TIGR03435 family)
MNPIEFVAEWALRSSILIACGAALLAVLRVKDSSVRLAAWTSMLAGSLLIPAMMALLPSVPIPGFHSQPPAVAHATQNSEAAELFVALPLTNSRQQDAPTRHSLNWAALAFAAYCSVTALLLFRMLMGLMGSLRLLREIRAAGHVEFRESDRVNSPVTVGLIRPVIVLPTGWPQWESAKLRAVLAHETAHIRRRDPLVQFVSAIHRAALWFSPLSWLLHARIVALAEEASDDAAITEISEPAVYAEVLLDFMRRPALRSRPMGIPMARYGRPDHRIERILKTTSLSRGLTRWTIAGILVIATPLTYLAAVSRPQKKGPQIIAQVAPPAPPPHLATSRPTERPRFDAASIKPCDPDAAQPGGRGGKISARFRRNCVTIKTLIQDAYIRFADGKSGNPMLTPLTKIEGGPAWINSDQYTIEAEPREATTGAMMSGPMTQMLLEDRLQLRVHRETRDGPIYQLTVAKGGSKLSPAKQGPCVRSDFADSDFPYFDPPPEMANMQCSFFLTFPKQPNMIMTARNASMVGLAAVLTRTVDRLVVDKTGITENVDFKMVYSSANESHSNEFEQAPIFTAIQQQLGLKLEPARGPRDYLVIDSISRPSSN